MNLIKRVFRHFFIFLLGFVQIIVGTLIAGGLIVIPIINLSRFLGSMLQDISLNLSEAFTVYVIWSIAGVLFITLSYKAGEETIHNYKLKKEGTLAGFIKKKIRNFKEE